MSNTCSTSAGSSGENIRKLGGGTNRCCVAISAKEPLKGQPVVVVGATASHGYVVDDEGPVTVAFRRGEKVDAPKVTVASGSVTVTSGSTIIESSISGTVTGLKLHPGNPKTWTSFPIRSRVLGRWRKEIPVSAAAARA